MPIAFQGLDLSHGAAGITAQILLRTNNPS